MQTSITTATITAERLAPGIQSKDDLVGRAVGTSSFFNGTLPPRATLSRYESDEAMLTALLVSSPPPYPRLRGSAAHGGALWRACQACAGLRGAAAGCLPLGACPPGSCRTAAGRGGRGAHLAMVLPLLFTVLRLPCGAQPPCPPARSACTRACAACLAMRAV